MPDYARLGALHIADAGVKAQGSRAGSAGAVERDRSRTNTSTATAGFTPSAKM